MESNRKSVYLVLYLCEYVEELRVSLQRYMDGWKSVEHLVCAMTVVFCQSGNGDIKIQFVLNDLADYLHLTLSAISYDEIG